MNKQTLFVSLTTAVMLCACQSSKVKISGRFVGNDAKDVYLEQVLPLTQSVIDSAVLDKDGNYRFELKGVAKTPSLYNIIYNGERIPLFLAGGEKLSLNSVGSVVRNYTVEGSKESELLRQFYQAFVTGAQQLENMGTEFARKLTDEERKSLIKEYTTKAGRKVYDGGGVMPDIATDPEYISRFALTLYALGFIEDFGDEYTRRNPGRQIDIRTFSITDKDYADFAEFMQDKKVPYESDTRRALKALKKAAEDDRFADLKNKFEQVEAELKDDTQTNRDGSSRRRRSSTTSSCATATRPA